MRCDLHLIDIDPDFTARDIQGTLQQVLLHIVVLSECKPAALAIPIARAGCMQVVPFTPAAGLLEWVEETEPLLPYLIGDSPYRGGAWGRYHRPQDKDFVQSRAALEDVQKKIASPDEMATRFSEVRPYLSPILLKRTASSTIEALLFARLNPETCTDNHASADTMLV